ncbi:MULTISPECIES: HAMP domain-containing protein [Haloarcula]|uniref:Type I deoxyribonuclease HsdR n=1 Tax=Haloarcula pellucida TaxID=1427151 RepID=A0A830GJP6_9EURY|nr:MULTISPECIES: HAMP domain-containing protein [Halomicroarcula]MBX0347439.1 methyl-accepting chemotaxis protein [Halomicroarcula pellucida]MDS0276686.1 methyl-accepting chemotaxis protein [Halomicroarcula sp. S1AR25-4]GGN88685.1 type I deoxyribonuclease HsdR [Halomicroarcula pellucida]
MSGQDTDSAGVSGTDDTSGGLLATIVPDVIRRNFALKFGIVLVVMALSVGAIGLLATDQVRTYTENQVTGEYRGVAAQEGDIIEQWFERNRLSVQFVSSSSVWTSDDAADLRAELRNRKAGLSADVANVHLVERQVVESNIVASTSLSAGTNVSAVDRGWTTDTEFNRAGEVVHSSVYQTQAGPVVGFMSPVDASQNRYIVIEYSIAGITESLQGSERSAGGFTQVVNASNVVMFDEGPDGGVGDALLQPYASGSEATKPISDANDLRSRNREAGVVATMPANSVLDEKYTVGYSPIEGTDWVVLVHAPYSAVFGFVENVQLYGLAGTALMVLLIGGVGAALGYNTATSIDRLTRKTDQMRQGNLDVDISTSRIDNIGRLYDGFGDMRDALKQQIDEAERAQKEAEVSRAEAMEVNNYLQEKAAEFSDVMEAAAAGNLTERMETDGENESMDRIASEFNGMINELEKTVGQLKSFADDVADSGDVVLTSAESVRDASEQVAESVQKISDDAYDQKDRLQTLSEDLDHLVETLEQLEAENPEVDMGDSLSEFRTTATTLQEAADTSEDMMSESETVAGAAEEQAAELNEVSSRAERLKRYAQPLGDILNRFETEAEHEFVFSGGPSQGLAEHDDE